MMDDRLPVASPKRGPLSTVYEALLRYPGIGHFLAFQYTIDLNYSALLGRVDEFWSDDVFADALRNRHDSTRTPTKSEGRSQCRRKSTRGRLGAHAGGVSACLRAGGGRRRDDRRFLEALHFFTVENVRWRALPECFGPWNSIWKRFDRLSKAGVFEAFFDTLASMSATAPSHTRCSIRPSFARMCGRPSEKRGKKARRSADSRGGFTTKIHAKSDASGDIIAFDLTGGEASDARHFETLLDIGPDIQPRAAICDKGYASKANRQTARARGIAPVIPHKANEKNKPAFFARTLYKARARIEQGAEQLKRFKRVALRCEKTNQNFRSIVAFAAGLCLIKFVHTTLTSTKAVSWSLGQAHRRNRQVLRRCRTMHAQGNTSSCCGPDDQELAFRGPSE